MLFLDGFTSARLTEDPKNRAWVRLASGRRTHCTVVPERTMPHSRARISLLMPDPSKQAVSRSRSYRRVYAMRSLAAFVAAGLVVLGSFAAAAVMASSPSFLGGARGGDHPSAEGLASS